MNKQLVGTLCLGIAAALLTGCAAQNEVVRGQSPGGYPGGQPVAYYPGEVPADHWAAAHGVPCPNGNCPQPSIYYGGSVCPHGVGGMCYGCQRHTWHPTHKHHFTYEEPQDLVYPPQNSPAAIVQYPYYTVKGPDDFFYTGD